MSIIQSLRDRAYADHSMIAFAALLFLWLKKDRNKSVWRIECAG